TKPRNRPATMTAMKTTASRPSIGTARSSDTRAKFPQHATHGHQEPWAPNPIGVSLNVQIASLYRSAHPAPTRRGSPGVRAHRLFLGEDSVICFWQRHQPSPARSYPALPSPTSSPPGPPRGPLAFVAHPLAMPGVTAGTDRGWRNL